MAGSVASGLASLAALFLFGRSSPYAVADV